MKYNKVPEFLFMSFISKSIKNKQKRQFGLFFESLKIYFCTFLHTKLA